MNLNQIAEKLMNAQMDVQTLLLVGAALVAGYFLVKTVANVVKAANKVSQFDPESVDKKIATAVASATKGSESLKREVANINSGNQNRDRQIASVAELVGKVASNAQWKGEQAPAAPATFNLQTSAPAAAQVTQAAAQIAKEAKSQDFASLSEADKQAKVISYLRKPSKFKFRSIDSVVKACGGNRNAVLATINNLYGRNTVKYNKSRTCVSA